MASQKLTKKDFDKKVLELLLLQEQQAETNDRIKDLKNTLEAQYEFDASVIEIIQGNETIMEKTPVDNGRNKYDTKKLRKVLKPTNQAKNIIKRVEVVDTKALNKLVKMGQVTEEMLDKCRESRWTFRTTFKRIEEVIQKTQPKTKQKKAKNIIDFDKRAQ